MYKMVNLFKISEAELDEMESFRAMTPTQQRRALDIAWGSTDNRGLAFELGFRLAGIGWSQAHVSALDALRLEGEVRFSLLHPLRFGLTLVLENGEELAGPVDYWDRNGLRFSLKGGRRIDYAEVKEHSAYSI